MTNGNAAKSKEDGVPRPNERQHGHPQTDQREAGRRGGRRCTGHEQRPSRERGREDGLARELVEHEAVPRVDEERCSYDEGDLRPERERGPTPGDDRGGEEDGAQRLGERSAHDVERES